MSLYARGGAPENKCNNSPQVRCMPHVLCGLLGLLRIEQGCTAAAHPCIPLLLTCWLQSWIEEMSAYLKRKWPSGALTVQAAEPIMHGAACRR